MLCLLDLEFSSTVPLTAAFKRRLKKIISRRNFLSTVFLSGRIRAAEASSHVSGVLARSLFFPSRDQAGVICCVTQADSLIDPAMIQRRHTPGTHTEANTPARYFPTGIYSMQLESQHGRSESCRDKQQVPFYTFCRQSQR